MQRIIVITGTDTGAGKTFLTMLLTAHLRAQGVGVAALKPISSGGRDDARNLHAIQNGNLSLNELNTWHFRAPLAPLLAARKEKRQVALREVIAQAHSFSMRFDVVLLEGAGGVLSPLGEGFSTADIIRGLGADAFVVAPNRLGALNHVLLTLRALPLVASQRARVVLNSPRHADAASRTNPELLSELIGGDRVHVLPYVTNRNVVRAIARPAVKRVLNALLR